jgi:peptide/nickel transport system permease protein
MIRRAVVRFGSSVAVVWLVLTVTFLVSHTLPSDPARAMAGPQARPADVARIRAQLGFDRPLIVQYAHYFRQLARGDLGMSYQRRKPVTKILAERIPRTAMLAIAAILVQVGAGAAIGVMAALHRGRALDHGAVALALVGVSAPTFLTGVVLQYWFAYRMRILPLDGFGSTVAERAACMVLPVLTLGLFGAAYYARFVRDEMINVLSQDFIRAARARGLSPSRVVLVHALRNAILPLVTIMAMDLGALMGGAVVTEKVFRWPGMGALSVDAVLARDVPVVMGVVLVTSLSVVVANFLADLAYGLLDPRLRSSPRIG